MTHTSDAEKYRVQLQFSPDRDGELYSKIHELLVDVKARNRAHRVKQILSKGLECQPLKAGVSSDGPTKVHLEATPSRNSTPVPGASSSDSVSMHQLVGLSLDFGGLTKSEILK